jgi:hypothetical protein
MLSGEIDGFFVVMAVLVVASLLLPVVYGCLVARRDPATRKALWQTATTVLPGAAFLVERAVRSLGFAPELIEQHRYVVFLPCVLGTGCGVFLIRASTVALPPLRGRTGFDLIRLIQVATWGLSALTLMLSAANV